MPNGGTSAPDPPLALSDLIELLDGLDDEALADLVADLPQGSLATLLDMTAQASIAPADPAAQAFELDEGYRSRDHLTFLSERLAAAAADVEAGTTRYLRVSMPPRSGKSLLISVYFLIWLLRHHPDWKIGLISHTPSLAVSWGRAVRRLIEEHGATLGLALASDAGAASEWQTTGGGGIVSRSAPGQSVTGLGFKVLIVDDIVKDFASAHSQVQRDAIWDYWRANSYTRLEPPALVIVVGTRWHEDDFLGRLASVEYDGDPDRWEVIEFPAIAETNDVLGRSPGEPLMSPLLDESPEQAIARYADIKETIGSYAFDAIYQQRPGKAKGAIFDLGWWKYWTTNPEKATEDGRVVLLDPTTLSRARWLDSWDCAFKGLTSSDYVVGQRWVRVGPRRYLIASTRARRTFTSTLDVMRKWANPFGTSVPCSAFVHERAVEDKANGTAVIDVLTEEIAGMVAINPTTSKTARARAVTPECESGHVFLPLPSDPGNEWVQDLLDEVRNFPTGAHDDQVDALSQALTRLREARAGSVTVPGRVTRLPSVSRGQTALQAPVRKYTR